MNIQQITRKCNAVLHSYIVGDALGVPFEFREKGSFNCTKFIGGGTYNQPEGTFSDDTSIILCLMRALTEGADLSKQITLYKKYLRAFKNKGQFTQDGVCFDLGEHFTLAINNNFPEGVISYMGNGAMFYSVPLALYLLPEDDVIERNVFIKNFVSLTHNNPECVEHAFKFAELIRNNILNTPLPAQHVEGGDTTSVVDTYARVVNTYRFYRDSNLSTFGVLCKMVNQGGDTDTNAALLGALFGSIKGVQGIFWNKVRKNYIAQEIIDPFIEKVIKEWKK